MERIRRRVDHHPKERTVRFAQIPLDHEPKIIQITISVLILDDIKTFVGWKSSLDRISRNT